MPTWPRPFEEDEGRPAANWSRETGDAVAVLRIRRVRERGRPTCANAHITRPRAVEAAGLRACPDVPGGVPSWPSAASAAPLWVEGGATTGQGLRSDSRVAPMIVSCD